MFASSKAAGICFAFPDVCLTIPPPPPKPVPYPNTGLCAVAVMESTVVKIQNMPCLHKASIIPVTFGDEPGFIGGVKSGTIKMKVSYLMGVPKVLVEGNHIVTVTMPTMQNNTNANGAQILQSQTCVDVTP